MARLNVLEEVLDELSIQLATLSNKQIEQVYKLWNSALIIQENRYKHYQSYVELKPSLVVLSQFSQLSRQTIYNHQVLLSFSKHLINEMSKDDLITKLEYLRNEIRIKDEIIQNLVNADARLTLIRINSESG